MLLRTIWKGLTLNPKPLRLVIIELQYREGFWFLLEDFFEDYSFAW